MSIPVNCASHLRELEHQIQFWQLAAPELPVWLTRVLETACEYTQNTTDNSGAAARKLVAALEIFHQATAGGHWPTASAVRVLWPVLEETYQIFAAAPDRENPRSLAMVRHSLVNVLIPLNLTSPEFLTQKLQAALAALHEENTAHTLRADLERCLDAVTENVTPEGVQVIGDVLGNWHDTIQKALAMVSSHPAPLSDVSTPLRGALIIEDQWWGDVLEQRVRAALPEVVRVWRVRTLQDALNALNAILTGSLIKSSIPLEVAHRSEAEDAEMPPSGVIEEENDEWSQQEVAREISVRQREAAECEGDLLVFLDLGLPQDEAALRRGHISRAHGKQLLGRLRNYAINARTIVLTSPSEYLPDHLWISQQGIAPEDFILKTDREWDKEIDEALRRALERSHTIRCIELDEENGVVWMDGIEISFASMDFKIVSILCENLKEKPEPQHRRRAYSCAEITERLSEYFDETCEAENIPTHIHTIRRCIHERFNEAGRSISAHRVVATEFYGEEVRYRIVAKQFLRKGQPFASVVSAVTVLVVEDNAAWRNAIAEPLREVGYEVETASDITAAIEVTKSVSPTVLCVDMQLPLLTTDAARDEEGGLRVIERVREIDPEARVVVLTDLAQHDRLRLEAMRRGVWIHDYIHKADPAWQWKLHRSIWRLTREWQQGIDLSQSALREGHVVELSRSNPRDLRVDGISIPLSKNRAKLIQALARYVDERIATEDLQTMIYGEEDQEDRSNALIQLVKNVRKQIEDDAAEQGHEVNAKHIIAEESGGYILCGPVLYRD